MARLKRSSEVLEKAERRAAGLRSINSKLDLGGSLTLETLTTDIEQLRSKLNHYNELLSTIDAAQNELIATEKSVKESLERMLSGIASRYGRDSHEYEMAGGVRKSERKRPSRKTTPDPKP